MKTTAQGTGNCSQILKRTGQTSLNRHRKRQKSSSKKAVMSTVPLDCRLKAHLLTHKELNCPNANATLKELIILKNMLLHVKSIKDLFFYMEFSTN